MLDSVRRLLTVLATAGLCVAGTIVGGAAPAHAAVGGDLQIKGPGSLYTQNLVVNQGVIPGGAARSWSYKIVNTGSDPQQYKVTTALFASGFTALLYKGTTQVRTPYYTQPIAPGGSLVLTLKVQIAAGQLPGEYFTAVDLRDPDTDAVLDELYAGANATYQSGTKRNDLFLKTGSQPYVGGSMTQYETANALKVGGSAVFTLRLRNDGTSPASNIRLSEATGSTCPSDFTITVKRGTTNVTGAVLSGTYVVPSLAPGAKIDFKVTIKRVSSTPDCQAAYMNFRSNGPDGLFSQAAHVVTAA